MKMSYKIALVIAVAVVVLTIILFTGSPETEQPASDVADNTVQPEPAPRKTLQSHSPQSSLSPGNNTAAPGVTTAKPSNSLAQDIRNRIKAADNTPDQLTDQSAAVEPDNKPGNEQKPDAIALTRTDTDATTTTPETDAAPVISRADLDAILGAATPTGAAPASTASGPPADPGAASADAVTDPQKPRTLAAGKYIIQPGDTLSSIAKKHYGDESKWELISKENFVDPIKLRVGQELRIPALTQVPVEEQEPQVPLPVGVKTYIIRPGDSLSTVAEKHYGDPTLWRIIYNYNRKIIGDNPNAIQAGMTLKVPPRVSGAR